MAKLQSPLLEQSARHSLLGGACTLALGLGLVGVGATTLGALPVLIGLSLTILSIHFYGRLGPDEALERDASQGDADDVPEVQKVANTMLWRGGLALAVSAAVTLGSYANAKPGERFLVLAGPVVWGVANVFRGWNLRVAARRAKARVEKRRRMDKSPAP